MSYSSKEIEASVKSLRLAVAGGLVRKVISPRKGDRICLELRTPGENHYLQVCVAQQFCSIGRIPAKPRAQEVPSSFVMLLRKHVTNCRIAAVEQLNNDRVVAIRLLRKEERVTLLCELSGRHGNLFLLNNEERILGSYYPNRSNKRQLVVGEIYMAPFQPPPMAAQRIRVDAGPGSDMALMVIAAEQESAYELAHKRTQVNRAANALLKKQRTLVKNLQADQENAARAETMQAQAYVIQANLHGIQRGQALFEGTDFEGTPIRISLNPKLSAVENMQAMFEKAGRLARATDKIEERLLQAILDEEKIAALKAEIETAGEQRLNELLAALRSANEQVVARTASKRAIQQRLPYKQFAIFGAHTARVGKNAKDNDALTLRHARANDLWLHVRGLPGSHVVVPLGRGEEPSQDVLIDAAHLAVHFSSARGDDHVEVTYTTRKYVQKPKGFPVGAVRLLKEKTFVLKVDPERLLGIMSSNS